MHPRLALQHVEAEQAKTGNLSVRQSDGSGPEGPAHAQVDGDENQHTRACDQERPSIPSLPRTVPGEEEHQDDEPAGLPIQRRHSHERDKPRVLPGKDQLGGAEVEDQVRIQVEGQVTVKQTVRHAPGHDG